MMLKLIVWSIIVWPLYILIRIPLIILGLIITPINIWYYEAKGKWLFWLWGNDENGLSDTFYTDKYGHNFWTYYKWLALRNPANNMRFAKYLNCYLPDVSEYGFYGASNVWVKKSEGFDGKFKYSYMWAKEGSRYYTLFFMAFAWSNEKYFELKLGHKVYPEDCANKQTWNGLKFKGFGFQLKPYRNRM